MIYLNMKEGKVVSDFVFIISMEVHMYMYIKT